MDMQCCSSGGGVWFTRYVYGVRLYEVVNHLAA